MNLAVDPDYSVAIGVLRRYQCLIFTRAMTGGKVGRIRFKRYNIDEKGNKLLALSGTSIIKQGQFNLVNAFININEKNIKSIVRAILF